MNTILKNLFPQKYPSVIVDSAEMTMGTISQSSIDNPESFGYNFNLIRAVQEYGPQRIDAISKRLFDMEKEAIKLREERQTLEALVAIVTPSP